MVSTLHDFLTVLRRCVLTDFMGIKVGEALVAGGRPAKDSSRA